MLEKALNYTKNNKLQVYGLLLATIALVLSLLTSLFGYFGGLFALATFLIAGYVDVKVPTLWAKTLLISSGLIALYYLMQLISMMSMLAYYGMLG